MKREIFAIVIVSILITALVITQLGNDEKTPPDENTELIIETVAKNLTVPWDIAFASEDKIFVTERPGKIRTIVDETLQTEPWAQPETYAQGEAGLLGIALHPEFSKNGLVYIYHTYRIQGDPIKNRIVRYTDEGEHGEMDQIILDNIPAGNIHDGGRIEFGPDGKLYATTGETGNKELAQHLDSLAGKILRINPDGTIPADNPFSGSPVWSYGHRNPEGLAWHPETNQLYATEHGPSGHDELNRIQKGKNYGWPEVAGKGNRTQYVDPILESGSNTWAPSGTTSYHSEKIEGWKNDLFFATLGFTPGAGRRSIHRVSLSDNNPNLVTNHIMLLSNQFGRLRAVAEGPEGNLYLTTSNRDGRGTPVASDDRILKITGKDE